MAEVEFTETEEREPAIEEPMVSGSPLGDQFMQNVQKMERPMPGQSLTNDPENPLPFEQPPRFVDKSDALEFLFASFVEERKYIALMSALKEGMPIMDLTKVLLISGFQDGMWNYDLMMILIEPTAYMIMALAERADIDFVVINPEDDDDADDEEKYGKPLLDEGRYSLDAGYKTKDINRRIGETMSVNTIPSEITEQIENIEVPESLMARP
jgi:hypothetical protein